MLKNKKILFICTPFFEYPLKIKTAIEAQNGEVDLNYINRKSLLSTLLLNLGEKLLSRYRWAQQKKILAKAECKRYDYVFIQYPFYLRHEFMASLKKQQSTAKFINYNWDSILERNYLDYIKYFDKVFSFDQKDCEQDDRIEYLPLFYTNDFKSPQKFETKYHVTFVGGIGNSKHRYGFVKMFANHCNKRNYTFFAYMHVQMNYFIKSLLKGKYYADTSFKKLYLYDIAEIYRKSNCILDYHNPNQNGLTMRTFEVLGSGCKLITTNSNISSEPFFDKKNIRVINPNNIEIDSDFIELPKSKIEGIERYSLDNWIKQIFA